MFLSVKKNAWTFWVASACHINVGKWMFQVIRKDSLCLFFSRSPASHSKMGRDQNWAFFSRIFGWEIKKGELYAPRHACTQKCVPWSHFHIHRSISTGRAKKDDSVAYCLRYFFTCLGSIFKPAHTHIIVQTYSRAIITRLRAVCISSILRGLKSPPESEHYDNDERVFKRQGRFEMI